MIVGIVLLPYAVRTDPLPSSRRRHRQLIEVAIGIQTFGYPRFFPPTMAFRPALRLRLQGV
jgi:hypothetical protein